MRAVGAEVDGVAFGQAVLLPVDLELHRAFEHEDEFLAGVLHGVGAARRPGLHGRDGSGQEEAAIRAGDPGQVDPATGRDLRPPDASELRLEIWTGRVLGVRVLPSEPASQVGAARERLFRRIESHSPLRPTDPGAGDLLRARPLNDYLLRLNRHPGRRVDAVISPALEPGGVYLSYRVTQERPWTLYASTGDTGTRRTGRDRQTSRSPAISSRS